MPAPSQWGDVAPGSRLYASESHEPPCAGTERHPGGPSEPQTGAQSLDVSVVPYRADGGRPLWAWRCWGCGGCDGQLGTGHDTEESARAELSRHLAEHPNP